MNDFRGEPKSDPVMEFPCGMPCHACIEKYGIQNTPDPNPSDWLGNLPYSASHMIVCETCGNKRCPHASDHELQCTDSNEPGQAGSVYR